MEYNNSILEYLEGHGLRTWTKGNNVHVKRGAVAIQCPFCGDRSNHLQVYPDGWMRCWRCGERRTTRLITYLEGCNTDRAKEILARLTVGVTSHYEDRERPDQLALPSEFIEDIPGPHRRYLEGRNFDPDRIKAEYGIMAAYNQGKYKFRVVIPLFLNGQMVHFTCRAITDRAHSSRYLSCPDEDAVMPMGLLLYNIDALVGDTVLIVEGSTDVWRMGPGTVGIMTTEFTPGKANLLRKKGVKRVFDFHDPGAEKSSVQVESMLYWVDEIIHKRFVDPDMDPAKLSEDDASALRREIFGR